jgi:hypothetical protein
VSCIVMQCLAMSYTPKGRERINLPLPGI